MLKRNLTTNEIEDILSFIKPQKGIPIETANSIIENNKNDLRKQLNSQLIYPEMIKDLKNIIEKQYFSCMIQAGESVGVIGAQSIGEKQTQTTLNTFHTAGSGNKTVTTGVPRVEELLNATKDPKAVNCTIFMKEKHNSIEEVRKTISHDIVEITFNKIAKSYEIIMNKKQEPWYQAFKLLYNDNYTKYTDCISLKFDMDVLYEYRLDMKTIMDFLEKEYSDMAYVYSPDNIGQFDIFVDTESINLPENRLVFVDSENAKQIYLEEVVQPILYKIVLCGIQGIKTVFFKEDTNSFETDGTNFRKILGLSFIDNTKTISNNVWDIYDNLGVEAARQFLIEEFMSLMEGINKCHIQLLVDKMTYNGGISSISRYTMRTEESGPFSKASFEETMDNFLKAGVFGQEEETKGVSSSVICGKRSHIGTGFCELRIDVEKLPGQLAIVSEVSEVSEKDKVIKNIENKDDSKFKPKIRK
jgi:DNA-directed RNA polymerase beta' subunit